LELHERSFSAHPVAHQPITTGSSVTLLEPEDGAEWEVLIVSSAEADPEADRISDRCPIGEALLGRRPGDQIVVDVPLGTVRYRVISVSRPID
jgi:transcription elongation factor GreA